MTEDDHFPRVLLASALTSAATSDGPITLRAGNLELDVTRWTVHQGGKLVELSPTEFRLLAYLMINQGRIITREQILQNVWGAEQAHQPQIVDTYVSYLRRKLDPLGPPLIHTQRGAGYILRPRGGAGRNSASGRARARRRRNAPAVQPAEGSGKFDAAA